MILRIPSLGILEYVLVFCVLDTWRPLVRLLGRQSASSDRVVCQKEIINHEAPAKILLI